MHHIVTQMWMKIWFAWNICNYFERYVINENLKMNFIVEYIIFHLFALSNWKRVAWISQKDVASLSILVSNHR